LKAAVNIYRGTVKQDRDMHTVESCGFENLQYDEGTLRYLKTTIFHGIVFREVLITNRGMYIILNSINI
jgi:hypothetical protein